MSERPLEPPVPGDPAADGPRPPATWRDRAWALLAGSVTGVTVVQLTGVAYVAATAPQTRLSAGRLLLAFLVTVVWLLTAFWIAMGAWRRTVWGCPFAHSTTAAPARRCQRHAHAPQA